jgi:Transposase DDE domain group 1
MSKFSLMDDKGRKVFRLPNVKMTGGKSGLSGSSGLHSVLKVLASGDLGDEFSKCFPKEGSNRSIGSSRLALVIIAGLLCGHDCLDDVSEFEDDELAQELFGGKIPTAKTLGNFLRRFSIEDISRLRLFLTKLGYTFREHIQKVHPEKGKKTPHFKVDGTVHEQHGKVMEGCGWIKNSTDKAVWGYASQAIFDELGFSYVGELLSAEHPKGNASELLDQVLSPLRGKKFASPFEKIADVSGDSAYLTEAVVRLCMQHQASFTIAAPRTILWHEHLESMSWVPWEYSEADKIKWNKKKKSPPESLLARWHWRPHWAKETLAFPVIIRKEWRPDELFGQSCGEYFYHAVATNKDLTKQSYQQIVEDYRPRADVENQIKEFKHNFDAKHLPCLSKGANEVYFLFVLIAQNIVRWLALLDQPFKPHFAKKIRRKFINSPGVLLKSSRQLVLKVKTKFLTEVHRLEERWGLHSVKMPLLMFSTA